MDRACRGSFAARDSRAGTPGVRARIAITDERWFELLASQPGLEEVNFWQPGGRRLFKTLEPGELFLFKLHSPNDYIVGGGVFARASLLPVSLAWESFRIGNGARSLDEMRRLIERYRKGEEDRLHDYTIGCIILTQPFFLPREAWIPVPEDWRPNIVQGKNYDLSQEPGRSLYARIVEALRFAPDASLRTDLVADAPADPAERYGTPRLIAPRLGQGGFRVAVTEAYGRRCAVTGERVLPVLEAAHIQPYGRGGAHRVENGLLLRSDLHALFDRGYLTVTPARRIEVSRRIREDWENGRDYYALEGQEIRVPDREGEQPSAALLGWHNEQVFLG